MAMIAKREFALSTAHARADHWNRTDIEHSDTSRTKPRHQDCQRTRPHAAYKQTISLLDADSVASNPERTSCQISCQTIDWPIMPTEIHKLTRDQIPRASQVLAATFFDYSMFAFYFLDPGRQSQCLSWYLRNVLRCAVRYGEAYTTSEMSGVIFILPPDHTRLSIREHIQNGFLLTPLLLGFRNYKQSMDCERFVGDLQETLMKNQPHVYLWGLAVDPDQQHRGIGAALMQPILAQADSERLPLYLETHDERNVRYYQQYGFDLILSTRLPAYELAIWCMSRQPMT